MASKRRQRRKECAGKARHASREHAMIALKRGGDAYAGCHAYHCPRCGFWHLGHPVRYRDTLVAKWRWDRFAAA